jgi:phage-related protein (TIGR01555 family)
MGTVMSHQDSAVKAAFTATSNRRSKGQATLDGLSNVFSGMGTVSKDKSLATMFGMINMDRSQIDIAYRGDWMMRKGIDIPAFDTCREWRTWNADKDDVTEIEANEKKFKVQLRVMRAMMLGRLYGGGAILMGVDNGDPSKPLDPETVDVDQLKFLHTMSRWDLTTGPIEWDISSEWYGRPQWYAPARMNSGQDVEQVKMHPSRVITFLGNEIPDLNVANGWGDSVMQSLLDAITSAGTVNQSIAQLVSEAKLDVIKIPGLSENIINQEYEDRLSKRFSFANLAKSIFGMILLDKEEEWERIEQQFAGMPDVQKVSLMIASAAFDVPATRFLAQSPAGLSATGDSDTRNYYDRLSAEQKVIVSPQLDVLDQVLIRNVLGQVPEDEYRQMYYSWNPLWQMSDKDKANIVKDKAAAFQIDVSAGLINEVVLKKAREAQLIEDGTYPGLEQIIEEYDDDPDLEAAKAQEAAMTSLGAPPITDPNDPNYDETKDPNSPKFVAPAPQAPGLPAPPAQKALPNAKPKLLAPPKAQQKATTSQKNKAAVDGIVQRLADATRPRSLYVRRDVTNTADIIKWARKQGFKSVVPDMHVTIVYSKQPVDWLKIGSNDWGSDENGGIVVKPGGPRVMERFGSAVVLAFSNSDLQYRHRSMMSRGEDDGMTWGYDDYTPHVTITYDPGALDIENIQPYTGAIELGPEIFEEIKVQGFDPDSLEEKTLDSVSREQLLLDAIKGLPAPQVNVHVQQPPSAARRVQKRTKVVKRDERGRPEVMESEEISTEDKD